VGKVKSERSHFRDVPASSPSQLLARAEGYKGELDWPESAASNAEALADLSEDSTSKRAWRTESSSYAVFRGAMQADSLHEFRVRISEALAGYKTATTFYETMSDSQSRASWHRCRAMLAFLTYWLETIPGKRRRLVEQAWTLTNKALEKFEKIGDEVEYGRTYNQLCTSAFLAVSFGWSFQSRKKILQEAAEHGEKAVNFLSTHDDPEPLVKACVKTASYFGWLVEYGRTVEEKDECLEKARTYWLKAVELSQELAMIEIASVENYAIYHAFKPKELLTAVEKALDHARRTRDKFAIATTLDFLVCIEWDEQLYATEDPGRRLRLAERALEHSEEARHHYHLVNFTSPLGFLMLWDEAPEAEYYRGLAQDVETDSTRKLAHLERALDAAVVMLKQAKSAQYPEVILAAHHVHSSLLTAWAKRETSRDKKQKLLEQARKHRNKSVELTKQLKPYLYFSRGMQEENAAEIEAEIAHLADGPAAKTRIMRNAARHQFASIQLGRTDLPRWEKHGWLYYVSIVGYWQLEYANMLTRLYELTNDRRYLRRAAQASKDAGELFQRANSDSRVAECCWKSSSACDRLGEHNKAADGFVKASKSYLLAAAKIPALKALYQDHSDYMSAWSEIARSRYHHARREYGAAKEHYEAASMLLKTSTRWNHLASNYTSLAHVENGEDLSRQDQCIEAAKEFEEAARMFQETRLRIQTQASDFETLEQEQVTQDLSRMAGLRSSYCTARARMEEGRVLEKSGDYDASAEKYSLAAESLERVRGDFSREHEWREAKFLMKVARAWEMTSKAQAKTDPRLYNRASVLFREANRLAPNEIAKTLGIGHSQFCRGLGFGSKFLRTGQPAHFVKTMQLMEDASRYYLKSGFHNASEYAKATKRLFDAYSYLTKANKEVDQEKKAKLYLVAEKLLQASVDTYGETRHISAREYALKLLENAREEREMTVSLVHILQSRPLASQPISPPSFSSEQSVGVERFQRAYVRANLMSSPQNPRLGELLNLRIELANAGMAPAQLVMIEKAIPEGFEVVNKPNEFPVEGNRLILNGRRLDPLKTQELELVLKPKVDGLFAMTPRLLYIDENGNNKHHEPQPFEITVDAIGNQPATASSSRTVSSPIMEFLIKAFAEDYMKKRLSIEHAGWRSLPEIARSLKLPRSQLYGDARYGQTFGKPLQKLIKAGITEFRIFPGERGRGGNVIKVRAGYEKEPVKKLVESVAFRFLV